MGTDNSEKCAPRCRSRKDNVRAEPQVINDRGVQVAEEPCTTEDDNKNTSVPQSQKKMVQPEADTKRQKTPLEETKELTGDTSVPQSQKKMLQPEADTERRQKSRPVCYRRDCLCTTAESEKKDECIKNLRKCEHNYNMGRFVSKYER